MYKNPRPLWAVNLYKIRLSLLTFFSWLGDFLRIYALGLPPVRVELKQNNALFRFFAKNSFATAKM